MHNSLHSSCLLDVVYIHLEENALGSLRYCCQMLLLLQDWLFPYMSPVIAYIGCLGAKVQRFDIYTIVHATS